VADCPFRQGTPSRFLESGPVDAQWWCEALGAEAPAILGIDCDPCPAEGHEVCWRYQRGRAKQLKDFLETTRVLVEQQASFIRDLFYGWGSRNEASWRNCLRAHEEWQTAQECPAPKKLPPVA